MTKGQHGNKEAKKPKKADKAKGDHPVNPPAIPAGLAPTVAGMPKTKKR